MGKNDGNLGRAMIKSRLNKRKQHANTWVHTSDLADGSDWNRINFQSITEQNSLDDFLTTAELAGTEFEAERLNVKIVQPTKIGILTHEEKSRIREAQDKHRDLLRIPRRPLWKDNHELSSEQFQLKERDAFLEWRRKLAELQDVEHISLTPFEKNLEFWRQLWRVIERSDVIVQIVDARNPLLFHCLDLENYVKEVDQHKENVLLINKSDLLTEKQRLDWYNYFKSINVNVVFWSARMASDADAAAAALESNESEQTKNNRNELDEIEEEREDHDDEEDEEEEDDDDDEERDENEEEDADDEVTNDDDDDDESENETPKNEKQEVKQAEPSQNTEDSTKDLVESTKDLTVSDSDLDKCKVLTRDELISFFKNVHKWVDKAKPGITTIGMVGYPNVGKSSTINALIQTKKVAVSETPGKTKHYQTLFVDDELLLCDCPGLVFPSYVSTRGELLLNGILPVDQMRDHNEPMSLLISHIPPQSLEIIYGIMIPKPGEFDSPDRLPTVEELCSSYAHCHGYMNHKGMPDVQRASRCMIKDYINGKLIYCYPPPGIDEKSFQDFKIDPIKKAKYLERTKKEIQKQQEESIKVSQFDQEFFAKLEPKALTKGAVAGYSRNKGNKGVTDMINGKKHHNSHKREKLRRKTSHLDN